MRKTFYFPTWSLVMLVALLLGVLVTGPAVAAKVTLRFSTWWVGLEKLDELTKTLVREFEKQADGIEVKILPESLYSSNPKLKVMFAAGTGPDVYFVDQFDAADYIAGGMALPIDSYMKRDGIKASDYWPGLLRTWQAWWGNGATYGLPVFVVGYCLMAAPDLFDEAGLNLPPNDWDTAQFLSYTKKLTRDTNGDGQPDRWGITEAATPIPGVYGWFGHFTQGMVYNFGGDMVSRDGRRITLNSPEAIAAMRFIVELHTKHRVVGGQFPRTAAMLASTDTNVVFRADPGYNYTLIRHPKAVRQEFHVLTHAMFINPDSKNKEAAWEFVKWVAGPEGQRVFGKYGYPSALRDPELIKLFHESSRRRNILDIAAGLPSASLMNNSDPAFTRWRDIRDEWGYNLMPQAFQGKVDIATAIEANMGKWQKILDEFWQGVKK